MEKTWEDSIILKKNGRILTPLPPVANFTGQHHYIDIKTLLDGRDVDEYVRNDIAPLPVKDDREGYHDERHYDYWLSGLEEFLKIKRQCLQVEARFDNLRVLDFGCASGRVLRHFLYQTNMDVWGCDINEAHVLWCNRFLSGRARIFQNTSLPHLQVEDNFFDVVYCLSVFTHIETFETSWLCEIRRILKPGGIAYVSIHDETSWSNMPKDWGVGYAVMNHPQFDSQWLQTGFPDEKFVSRWDNDRSYSANVFYKMGYIRNIWGRFFEIAEVIPMGSNYQTVLVLRKTAG